MNPQTVLKDKIPPVALQVLNSSTLVEEDSIKLTCGQLDPADYAKVNEVFERIGGKWNGRKKAHLFAFNPKPIFNAILESGLMPEKNPLAFFPTPDAVADELVDMANLYTLPENPLVLDPSVGQGALLKALRKKLPEFTAHACELNELNRKTIEREEIELVGWDFLEYKTEPIYDLIIMNPPFSVEGDKKAWITHFNHAYSMLKPDGQLLLITPVFEHLSDKKTAEFKSVLGRDGWFTENEAKAFAASGTNIVTCNCCFRKDSPVKQLDRELLAQRYAEPDSGYFSGYVSEFFLLHDNEKEAYEDLQKPCITDTDRMQEICTAIENHIRKWYEKLKKSVGYGFEGDWRKEDERSACMELLERWAEHWELELKFPASHYFNLPRTEEQEKEYRSKIQQLELFA